MTDPVLHHRSFHRYDLLVLYIVSMGFWGFSFITVGQRGIRPDWLVGFLMFLAFYVNLCMGRASLSKDSILSIFLLMYTGLCLSAYSPFFSHQEKRVEDFLTTWLQFSLASSVFVAIIFIRLSQGRLIGILRWYVNISLCMAIFGMIQLIGSYMGFDLTISFARHGWEQSSGYEALTGPFKRSMALFQEPRQFGTFLVGSLALILFSIKSGLKLYKRRASYLIFMLLLLGLVSSMSVSATIVCGVSLLIAAAMGRYDKSEGMNFYFKMLVLLATVVIVLKAGGILGLSVWQRLNLPNINELWWSLWSMTKKEEAFGFFHYVGNMAFALRVFFEHPVTGVGMNNLEHFAWLGYSGAHEPWRFIAETGVVGVLSMLLFLIVLLAKIKRLKRKLGMSRCVSTQTSALLGSASLLILLAPLKGAASVYGYYSTFFWFDLSLASLIYFNLRTAYRSLVI